ncbi:CDP-glucose 4,6-dehydratase [Aquibium sp. A9E412]|uniref:CDP-glucose 4,6-dehydratase n=1 Tax=Aquibium sp. A9E412 TaxID=2976767 RepID=UPI0025AF3C19|nr:CDP-glucose 4,6-dehydratase [Aquibium sp. A9E412]MDN2566899.1 CDP-glucose 4,6-dehydratase [Aquibium sp. A9E412]
MTPRPDPGFWRGRRVLVTGHTGFKGTWARLWLAGMGAEVHGLSLPPDSEPALHALVGPQGLAGEHLADIRDAAAVARAVRAADPQIVLHMAAQALVRRGHAAPGDTFDVNVTGTVRLLEALRDVARLQAVLVVTTDKVYRNDESGRPFSEDDPLGGLDPYSASKAACELATAALAAGAFAPRGVPVATARGGNVIGGGDFASDRLVPDIVRAADAGLPPSIRNPAATRPWQHVLDCLAGYFRYLEALAGDAAAPAALNFGPPADERQRAVREVAEAMLVALGRDPHWHGGTAADAPREMAALALDPALAAATLGWRARLDQTEAIAWTARWYDGWRRGADPAELTRAQIARFTEA